MNVTDALWWLLILALAIIIGRVLGDYISEKWSIYRYQRQDESLYATVFRKLEKRVTTLEGELEDIRSLDNQANTKTEPNG